MKRAAVTQLHDSILSIEQAADLTPWSASTLYREARKAGSPFKKVAGRWVTSESKLHAWVEGGEKPRTRDRVSRDPIPPPRRRGRGTFTAQVIDLHARRAS